MSVKFYCCYLLQSSPKPNSFYIGSTPDPFRRLRQHNGELTQGAYRTKSESKRPWRLICCISGFQSQVSALQFEHAWQHAYQTRHIPKDQRIVTTKQQMYRSLDKHIGNLRLLIKAEAFSKSPLKVHLFEKTAFDCWNKNKFKIEIPKFVVIEEDVRVDNDMNKISAIGNGLLKESMKSSGELRNEFGVCPECNLQIELTEFAKSLLQDDPDNIIPSQGKCPSCNNQIKWLSIITNTQPSNTND